MQKEIPDDEQLDLGWSINRDVYDYEYEDKLCFYLERLYLAAYDMKTYPDYWCCLPLDVVVHGVKSREVTLDDLGMDRVEFMTLRARDFYKRIRFSVRKRIEEILK